MVRVTDFTLLGTTNLSSPGADHTQPLPKTVPAPHMGSATHLPPMQGTFWAHGLPQAPQLFTSALRLVSHPFCRLLSQSPNPMLQESEQTPLAHAATAFWPIPTHTLPQAPQLLTS